MRDSERHAATLCDQKDSERLPATIGDAERDMQQLHDNKSNSERYQASIGDSERHA